MRKLSDPFQKNRGSVIPDLIQGFVSDCFCLCSSVGPFLFALIWRLVREKPTIVGEGAFAMFKKSSFSMGDAVGDAVDGRTCDM